MSRSLSSSGKSSIWQCMSDNKTNATTALIKIVGSERIQSLLLDKNTIKKNIWTQIANELKEEGFDLGPDGGKMCHQKWRNLKRAYVVYVTTSGSKNVAPYMQELQKALQNSHMLFKPFQESDLNNATTSQVGNWSEKGDEKCILSRNHTCTTSKKQSLHLPEVLAIIQIYEEERREREILLQKREEERFNRIEALLQEQNTRLEKLTNIMLGIATEIQVKKRKLNSDQHV